MYSSNHNNLNRLISTSPLNRKQKDQDRFSRVFQKLNSGQQATTSYNNNPRRNQPYSRFQEPTQSNDESNDFDNKSKSNHRATFFEQQNSQTKGFGNQGRMSQKSSDLSSGGVSTSILSKKTTTVPGIMSPPHLQSSQDNSFYNETSSSVIGYSDPHNQSKTSNSKNSFYQQKQTSNKKSSVLSTSLSNFNQSLGGLEMDSNPGSAELALFESVQVVINKERTKLKVEFVPTSSGFRYILLIDDGFYLNLSWLHSIQELETTKIVLLYYDVRTMSQWLESDRTQTQQKGSNIESLVIDFVKEANMRTYFKTLNSIHKRVHDQNVDTLYRYFC